MLGAHLDKTLMGRPWVPHAAAPTQISRNETDKTILPYLTVSTEERAGNLIEACVARGTAHLRTHVDIDLESRLLKLDGVLAAPNAPRPRERAEIVAFPQSGVMRCPAVLDLLGGDLTWCKVTACPGSIKVASMGRGPI